MQRRIINNYICNFSLKLSIYFMKLNTKFLFFCSSIANWTPQLNPEDVRVNIKRAFESWASYSRLKFTEVFDSSADIIIAFATGRHGDGSVGGIVSIITIKLY